MFADFLILSSPVSSIALRLRRLRYEEGTRMLSRLFSQMGGVGCLLSRRKYFESFFGIIIFGAIQYPITRLPMKMIRKTRQDGFSKKTKKNVKESTLKRIEWQKNGRYPCLTSVKKILKTFIVSDAFSIERAEVSMERKGSNGENADEKGHPAIRR